ncbi:MAG: diacylglycerol kinase family protein [Firmicutes bacterium]|nr:diacylglycerol kinase family protein [Bacillota bacterium]
MKNIFILNPYSGRKKTDNRILKEIRDASGELGMDFEIYFTKSRGDGEEYIRRICREYNEKDESLRIYGVGGDGTVNEVANGAVGFDNVEVGIIPMGTGNDYLRNFGSPSDFLNIRKQLLGESRASDLIKYRAEYRGEVTDRYCANMFNIGFDCNVVDMTDKVKNLPGFSGSTAYLASVFIVLGRKRETDLHIEFDNGDVRDGKVLLISVANGCFCGGGIKGVPKAVTDDGLMDVSIVRSGVTRSQFVRLFPKYKKGTHLNDRLVLEKDILEYRQERRFKLVSKIPEGIRLCVDGEISSQDSVEFEVEEKAIRFIVPKGV